MIIDSHTHIYPDAKAARTVQSVRDRSGIQSYSDGTKNGLLDSMNQAGVDISLISNIATRPKQVKSINQWLQAQGSSKIRPLAAWHPDLASSPEMLALLKQSGFIGFKFHPDYQNFFVDDCKMFPLYETIAALGMPVLFHAGVDLGLPEPVHCTPQGLRNVLEAFPKLRIIAAHMGGDQMWPETEKLLFGRDLYMDTSFVLRKMPLPLIERFFKKHPIERFLFGSDTPWGGQKEDVEYILALPFLNTREKEMVLGQNAAQLYGINETTSIKATKPDFT
ncbi:MAG: amidohydrolase [Desulfobacteraceae bacterium]|nr:MAG: amidohydrolase [Desulfobacteraceae bacterium]